MSTDLTKSNQASSMVARYQPHDFDGMYRLAKMVVSSGLAPDGLRQPQDAMIVMMTGAELGLTAMQSLRSIHVIKGKPVLSADLQVALVRGLPQCEYFQILEWTDQLCTIETKRADGKPVGFTFTMKDAERAGLVRKGGNWEKYPKNMLRARAASTLARAEYPEIMHGVYCPDEAADIGKATVVKGGPTSDLNERFGANTKPVEEEPVEAEFEPAEGDDTEEGAEDAETNEQEDLLV